MTRRKPYVRPMTATWWTHNPFYIRYMVREATCLFVGGYSLVLLWGVYALKQGEVAWNSYLSALSSPLALVFHLVALWMALFHTVTFFGLTPKTLDLRIGKNKVPDLWIQLAHYAAFAGVTLIVLFLALGGW